jgi:hypothetical protein
MPDHLLTAVAFITALCLPLTGQCETDDEYRDLSVIGDWRITAVLDFADISSLNDRQAKRLLGQVMMIREDSVRLGKRECSPSEFWAERVVPELDIREKVHASAENLKLPNPVTVVELSCTYVYVRDKDHLVLLWGGAFFDTVRVGAKPRGAKHEAKKARQPQPRPADKAEPDKVQRVLLPFEAP